MKDRDEIEKNHAGTDLEPSPKPGEKLLEVLRERNMSQTQLARRLGRPKKLISDVIKGKATITPDTALQFEQVLEVPAATWLELEARYQAQLAEKRLEERAAKGLDWLDELPVDAMVAAKWIPRARTEAKQMTQLLRWFGVANPQAWRDVFVEPQARYHRSPPLRGRPRRPRRLDAHRRAPGPQHAHQALGQEDLPAGPGADPPADPLAPRRLAGPDDRDRRRRGGGGGLLP